MPVNRHIEWPGGTRMIKVPSPQERSYLSPDEELILYLATRVDEAEIKLNRITAIIKED